MGSIGSPNYLNLSPYKISLPAQRMTLSFTSHWFLIQVLSSIIDIYTFGNSQKIYFSSENMVANGWFRMYLNQDQFQFLKDSTYFNLYPIENKNQIKIPRTLESHDYYVYASSDWTPPTGSRIVSRVSDTLFYVNNLVLTPEIQNDQRILKIVPAGVKQALNRYILGFLQNGQQKSYYADNIFAPLRPLSKLGLNGTGQVINVVDTGVDVLNAFFYDPKPENDINSITGKTNKNHRKIVRLEPIVDNTDSYRGHGTHVAGTACGEAYCTECGISQYNGIASGAKLYFSDIGNSTSGKLAGTVDLAEQYEIFKELDVHISSNSWGFNSVNSEVEFTYNKGAYEHPYVLYLFAAGNSYSYNTINSPGNAKNVFTVSSMEFISSSFLEYSQGEIYIHNETHSVRGDEMMNKLIYQNSVGDPMKYYINLSLTQFEGYLNNDKNEPSSYYKDSAVVLNKEPGNDHDICVRAKNVSSYGAAAAFYVESEDYFVCDPIPEIPMIRLKKEGISFLLQMGEKVSLLLFEGEERALPEAAMQASKGPANSGLRKPDVIVPGTNINSASSHGPELDYEVTTDASENVWIKSGTSMATPAVAGLAAIVLQYLREGFYPTLKKGTGTSVMTPSSCLLRALLVNTAIKPDTSEGECKASPRNDVGFGTPFLNNVLGFKKGSSLRFIDNETIESNSHRVYRINLDSNEADLSVTLVFLDPPLNADNDAIFFADLDLYVKSPKGDISYGNNVSSGESLSLIERVIIEKSEIPSDGGEYEIHVISSKFPIESQKVMFAIAVNGPFDMSNVEKNPLFLAAKEVSESECPNNCNGNGKCVKGRCVCSDSFTGPFCNFDFKELKVGTKNEDTFEYHDIRYYRLPLKKQAQKVGEIYFDLAKSDTFGPVYFCTSFDKSPGKMTEAGWECHLACPKTDPDSEDPPPGSCNYTLTTPKESDPQFLHLSLYTGYSQTEIISIDNISLTFSSSSSGSDGNEKNKIPLFALIIVIAICLVVVLAIGLLVVAIIKMRRGKVNNNSTVAMQLLADQDAI